MCTGAHKFWGGISNKLTFSSVIFKWLVYAYSETVVTAWNPHGMSREYHHHQESACFADNRIMSLPLRTHRLRASSSWYPASQFAWAPMAKQPLHRVKWPLTSPFVSTRRSGELSFCRATRQTSFVKHPRRWRKHLYLHVPERAFLSWRRRGEPGWRSCQADI